MYLTLEYDPPPLAALGALEGTLILTL